MLKSLALLLLARTAAADMDCTLAFGKGTHYDLSELSSRAAVMVTGGDLSWTTKVEEQYNYKFAVCRNLRTSDGEVPQVCIDQGDTDRPIFQYQDDGANKKDCHPAGQILPGTTLELIDPKKPAAGVKLNYTKGSACHTFTRDYKECGATGQPECPDRQAAIHFVCAEEEEMPWGALEVNNLGQPSHCEYQIAINSMFACPQECGISFDSDSNTRKLCGGHGMCAFDKTNSRSKCFCDDGWAGNDCNTESTGDGVVVSGMSGTAIGLLVVLLLISIALVGLVVFMAKQVRAYRNDATNYMQIRGQEMSDDIGTI